MMYFAYKLKRYMNATNGVEFISHCSAIGTDPLVMADAIQTDENHLPGKYLIYQGAITGNKIDKPFVTLDAKVVELTKPRVVKSKVA